MCLRELSLVDAKSGRARRVVSSCELVGVGVRWLAGGSVVVVVGDLILGFLIFGTGPRGIRVAVRCC